MKKFKRLSLSVLLILSIKINGIGQSLELLKTTHLSHYSSASTIEFYNDHLYVIGDDANQLLILDKEHKIVDSILLFKGEANRIAKDEKADIESTILFNRNNRDYILALSSFSTPQRNKALIINTESKEVEQKSFLHSSFSVPGIKELNIEGAANIHNQLVLGNRANNSSKVNHLIVTNVDEKGTIKNTNSIQLSLSKKKEIIGISGFVYLEKKDLLLFTASTENTSDAVSDGTIGNSYIGIIPNISKKLTNKKIKVDKLLNLNKKISSQPQKIEAIAIESQTGNNLVIHLAADNDNGKSTLFKIILRDFL